MPEAMRGILGELRMRVGADGDMQAIGWAGEAEEVSRTIARNVSINETIDTAVEMHIALEGPNGGVGNRRRRLLAEFRAARAEYWQLLWACFHGEQTRRRQIQELECTPDVPANAEIRQRMREGLRVYGQWLQQQIPRISVLARQMSFMGRRLGMGYLASLLAFPIPDDLDVRSIETEFEQPNIIELYGRNSQIDEANLRVFLRDLGRAAEQAALDAVARAMPYWDQLSQNMKNAAAAGPEPEESEPQDDGWLQKLCKWLWDKLKIACVAAVQGTKKIGGAIGDVLRAIMDFIAEFFK
jgi:hypothetical protein